MAIYSCNISNVSRAAGSSSCATLSYIEAEKVYDERLGETFYGFGRSERVETTGTLLPDGAPVEYQDPAVLFNAVELNEKAANARTAKKIMVALPREFSLDLQKEVVESFIRSNLTNNGYAATYAIHTDKDNNNPHAHILVANRQINEKGEWHIKRKMEYALDDKGDRIPLLNPDGTQKVDKRNRKQWKRINVEQNPLDKKEFLQGLRESWAAECNKYLSPDLQIDHRSNEARGLEEEPTIHEGYVARQIEKEGGISERCEFNRDTKERNGLIYQFKQLVNQVKELIYETIHRSRSVRTDQGIRSEHQRQRETVSGKRGAEKTDIGTFIRKLHSKGLAAKERRGVRDDARRRSSTRTEDSSANIGRTEKYQGLTKEDHLAIVERITEIISPEQYISAAQEMYKKYPGISEIEVNVTIWKAAELILEKQQRERHLDPGERRSVRTEISNIEKAQSIMDRLQRAKERADDYNSEREDRGNSGHRGMTL